MSFCVNFSPICKSEFAKWLFPRNPRRLDFYQFDSKSSSELVEALSEALSEAEGGLIGVLISCKKCFI